MHGDLIFQRLSISIIIFAQNNNKNHLLFYFPISATPFALLQRGLAIPPSRDAHFSTLAPRLDFDCLDQ